MLMRRLTCFLLLIALSFVVPTACRRVSAPAAPAVQMLHLLTARGARSFEAGQRQALLRLVAAQPRLTLRSHDAAGDPGLQTAQFAEALAARPFAILLDPVDPTALTLQVKAAVQAGILVIGLGDMASGLACHTVLSCDEAQLGKLAGQIALRALTLKAQEEGRTDITGRVVEIRGDDTTAACTARHNGFTAALQAAPGIIIVHDAPGGWTRQGGADRAKDAVRLQQNFDIIYAHNDLMALGAASVLGPLRETTLIIGTDGFRGEEGGLTLVGNGDIDATVFQPLLVDFAWVLIKKKLDDPAFQPRPAYTLTPRSVMPKDVDDVRRGALPPFPEL